MCGATPVMCFFNIDFFSKCYGINHPINMENSSRDEIITHYKVLARNNNPRMIGTLYLIYVSQSKITPRLVRSDRGSEYVVIAGIF